MADSEYELHTQGAPPSQSEALGRVGSQLSPRNNDINGGAGVCGPTPSKPIDDVAKTLDPADVLSRKFARPECERRAYRDAIEELASNLHAHKQELACRLRFPDTYAKESPAYKRLETRIADLVTENHRVREELNHAAYGVPDVQVVLHIDGFPHRVAKQVKRVERTGPRSLYVEIVG